jgi:hypothetical protein
VGVLVDVLEEVLVGVRVSVLTGVTKVFVFEGVNVEEEVVEGVGVRVIVPVNLRVGVLVEVTGVMEPVADFDGV